MNIQAMAKQMNDVRRFDHDCGSVNGEPYSWMEPSDNGDYVSYFDYAALQQQLAAAREALALFIEFDDAGEPPGDICFQKARATLQRDRQP